MSHCPNTILCKACPFTTGWGPHLDHERPRIHMGLSLGDSSVPRVSLSFPVPILHRLNCSGALFQAGVWAPERNGGAKRIIRPPLKGSHVSFPSGLPFIHTRAHGGRVSVHTLQMRTPGFREFKELAQFLQDVKGKVQAGPNPPSRVPEQYRQRVLMSRESDHHISVSHFPFVGHSRCDQTNTIQACAR